MERKPALPMTLLTGAAAGLAAGLVFAGAHALLIVPIWTRMGGGLVFAAVAGAISAWTFSELYPDAAATAWTRAIAAGARFGALVWVAIAPVSVMDMLLRGAGILPRLETLGVVVALAVATLTGSALGWHRRGTRRGMLAGAAATFFVTLATAGPVPIGRGGRALGIFFAILPACMAAGALLGVAAAGARRAGAPAHVAS